MEPVIKSVNQIIGERLGLDIGRYEQVTLPSGVMQDVVSEYHLQFEVQMLSRIPEYEQNAKKREKIYLAIPYTGFEDFSCEVADFVAGLLMISGNTVYSPISHCHQIAKIHKLPTDIGYWKQNAIDFVDWCDTLVVVDMLNVKDKTANQLNMFGSESIELIALSKGCMLEIDHALMTGKKVRRIIFDNETKSVKWKLPN